MQFKTGDEPTDESAALQQLCRASSPLSARCFSIFYTFSDSFNIYFMRILKKCFSKHWWKKLYEFRQNNFMLDKDTFYWKELMHLKAQCAISASQSKQNKRCSSWVQIQTLWRNKHQEPPLILLWSAAVICRGDLRCQVFIICNVDCWLEPEGKCTSWTQHYRGERGPECLLSAEFSQKLTWNQNQIKVCFAGGEHTIKLLMKIYLMWGKDFHWLGHFIRVTFRQLSLTLWISLKLQQQVVGWNVLLTWINKWISLVWKHLGQC